MMSKKIEEVRHLGEKKRPSATAEKEIYERDYSRYAFSYPTDRYKYVLKPGLSREVVEEISAIKNEPTWMREFRLRAYEIFLKKPMPTWGGDLSQINFDTITYYATPTDKGARSWEDVPDEVKKTFDRLGIPEAERKFLAGVGAQYDSEVVYHSIREDLAKKGVIFLSMDDGLREYPDLVKEYIGTVIPPTDNKFAALNSAVWSGGCLTAEARLFTPDGGIKSIAEVRCGDRVAALSPKGELVTATVVAHIHSGRKPVYRFRVAGRTLEATSNHLFLTLEKSPAPLNRFGRKWVMRWQPLANLKVGDVIAIAKRLPWEGQSKPLPPLPPYRRNHHLRRSLSAPAQTSPDLLWLLGVWMGDGNTYAPHPHMRFINFALPEGDPVRQEAIRLLHKLFQYSVKTRNSTSFTVYSKALGEWLAELGFTGKAKTQRIPSWVFGLPLEERLAFLGGLLDSDGWVENEGKTVSFELANRKLIEDIKMLAISCGLFSDGKIRERERRSALLKRENRQIISGTTYACRITGDVALIGSRHPRWRALLDQARKHTSDKYTTVTGENFSSLATEDIGFAPIREKEYIGVRDVYDIQVEGFANFVANGIIAHNSFIYVPKGVHVEIPLQAYFRINAPQMGQFERTLIIADEGSRVHYIEGCTAPVYSRESLHSAVVELIAKRGAHLRYTTLQNWSNDVYNLVTKRAVAYEDATVEWVDANIGCLTADTKVFLNPRGAVNITEINPNDWVYALDLNAMEIVKRPVKGVVCAGVKPVFKLITENHREIKATANHPFLALQRSEKHWQLVWKPLEQLQVGDFIAIIEELPPEEGKPAEFVRIKAIEPLGEEPVYDIEVESAHNFIANGLIVHNSRLTMKYPSVYMLGKGARADILSVAFAGKGQHQDTGGKAIHAAPYTTSTIVSKSVSKDGGRASYRGQLVVAKGAHHAKSNVRCDALILDERSRSDTYPYIEIDEDQVTIGHEATVGKVGDDQIFYLMSRGLSESEALSMIVLGFMEPFTKTLPMEYAIEFNRLIQLEMEGSVG